MDYPANLFFFSCLALLKVAREAVLMLKELPSIWLALSSPDNDYSLKLNSDDCLGDDLGDFDSN